jgi:hypothetical protein
LSCLHQDLLNAFVRIPHLIIYPTSDDVTCADFLGVKTKGAKSRTKAVGTEGRVGASERKPGATQPATQKRPSVAARKAKQLLAAGQISAADAKKTVQAAHQIRRRNKAH